MFDVPFRASSRTGGWRRWGRHPPRLLARRDACALSLALDRFLRTVADRDLLRALHRRLRHMHLEHTVVVDGHDLILVDPLRQGERAYERAVRPLAELQVACL